MDTRVRFRLLEILDTVTHKEQSRHSCTAVIACVYLLVKKTLQYLTHKVAGLNF